MLWLRTGDGKLKPELPLLAAVQESGAAVAHAVRTGIDVHRRDRLARLEVHALAAATGLYL
eukprot:COSAG04_NODE_8282_length_997_cov_0.995546_2_plen_61_part_00